MDEKQIITGIDEDDLRNKVHTILEGAGYKPLPVQDEEELNETVDELQLPVILLTESFGTTEIDELLDRIKEDQISISVMLIKNQKHLEEIRSAIDDGVDDFLVRPIDEELLPARIHRAVEGVQGKHMDKMYSAALEKRVNQRTQQLWDNIKNIRQQFVNTVHALCQALYAKHPYTEGHSWRVAKVSERIAFAMDLGGDELENIRLGALFHDIGKIGIRDHILDKPGRLTDREYEIIKEHPIIAEEILTPMEEFSDVVDIIKYEHENFDGTGYPYGISGEEIPLGARIVRVADTYDAVVTTRSYRKGGTHLEAVDEIKEAAGTHFCPTVTRYFQALFPEEEGGLPEEERQKLLEDRYEDVRKVTRRGFESEENFFEDLVEDTNEDVIIIGDRSS